MLSQLLTLFALYDSGLALGILLFGFQLCLGSLGCGMGNVDQSVEHEPVRRSSGLWNAALVCFDANVWSAGEVVCKRSIRWVERVLRNSIVHVLLAVPVVLSPASPSIFKVSTQLRTLEMANLGRIEMVEQNRLRWFESGESGQAWAGIDVTRGETSFVGGESFVVAEVNVLRLSDLGAAQTSELELQISGSLENSHVTQAAFPFSVEFLEAGATSPKFRTRVVGSRFGHSVSIVDQRAYGLEVWLADSDVPTLSDQEEIQIDLEGQQTKFFVLGEISELEGFSGVSSAHFDNPRSRPETVEGKGTSTISWPQVTARNQLEFRGREFEALPEQPFLLGEFRFKNTTQSPPAPIHGVDFLTLLELHSDGPYTSRFPLSIVETSNDGGLILDADRIRLDDTVASQHVVRGSFPLRLMLWFANPSTGGFTYHEGFGVSEDSESSAELWGTFTLRPESRIGEIITENEVAARNDSAQIEPRWVPSAERVSRTTGVVGMDVDDYDNDGQVDVVIVSQDRIELLRGDADQGWSTSTTNLSEVRKAKALFEDLNGDHVSDIALLGESIEIWLNSGAGQFALTSQEIPGQTYDYQQFGMDLLLAGVYGDMALGDVDGDGNTDLIVYSGREATNALYLNSGAGEFEFAHTIDLPQITDISTKGLHVAAVDLDGDGHLDLSASFFDWIAGSGSFLFNDGAGKFLRIEKVSIDTGPSLQSVTGSGLVVGDFNGDGDQDAMFLYRDAGNRVFSNDGAGKHGDIPGIFGRYTTRGWMEDLDGDGSADLILNHATEPIQIFDQPRHYLTISLGSEHQFVKESQRLNLGHVGAIAAGNVVGDERLELLIATETGVDLWQRGPSRLYPPKPRPLSVEDVVVRNRLTDLLGGGFSRLDLEKITHLDLELGMQTRVELPTGLVNLKLLQLRGDAISGLDLPMDLEGLDRVVVLRTANTGFELPKNVAFRVGEGLASVSSLDVFGFGITELTIEHPLPKLNQLGLGGNRLRDFSFLSNTLNLDQLDLRNNELKSLVLPLGPRSLEQLNVEGNELVSLSVPHRMDIRNLIGYSKESIDRFDPAPLISITHRDPTLFEFTAIGGGGEFVVEVSNDLLVWKRLEGKPIFENWFTDIELPIDTERPHQFFRIVKP